MRKTPVLAAVSAALLALAVPTYGNEGVTQKIKDEQYSRFVSGASLATSYVVIEEKWEDIPFPDWFDEELGWEIWDDEDSDTPEGWPENWRDVISDWGHVFVTNSIPAPWSGGDRETCTREGGLNPRYWSSTNGASVADVISRAPDGSHYYDSEFLWGMRQQPPVYGHVDDDQEYQPLYGSAKVTHYSLVDIDTFTAAPVVCRFAEAGDVVAADGSDIFFDANVTLEAFAYGEANRPDDSVLAPDTKLAIYIQDTKPTGDPRFFIVARDWNTGAVRHHRVLGEGCQRWLYEYDRWYPGPRYSGRIIVRAVRSVHKGFYRVVPAFLVYLDDGSQPLYWRPYDTDIGNPPAAGDVQWDKVRDDLGHLYTYNSNPLFKSLSPISDMRLSKVSYSGVVRLGAYAVGTADPMRTTVKWAADSSMIRLLNVDGMAIDEVRWMGAEVRDQYQGAEKVDAGSYTYYRELDKDRPGYVSWRGVNGWSDGSYTINPGDGCETTLGTNCFFEGRASLDTMPDDEESAAALEESLPARTGKRIGNRYIEVSDALAHAAVLGGTVKLLANPMDAIVLTQLATNVTVNLTDHDVPYNEDYQKALGLQAPSCADVIASPHPAVASVPTLTLTSGAEYGSYVYGGLCTTGVNVNVQRVTFQADSCICDAPNATVDGGFGGDLHVTNSVLSITGGGPQDLYAYGGSLSISGGSTDRVTCYGGRLSISGGYTDRVTCYGVNPVSITGGSLYDLALYDSPIINLGGVMDFAVTISNNPSIVVFGTKEGLVTLTDIHGYVIAYGHLVGGLDITRAGAVTVGVLPTSTGDVIVRDAASFVVESGTAESIRVYDTPVVELRGGQTLKSYWVGHGDGWLEGTIEMHGCGAVLLSGHKVTETPYCGQTATSTIVLSNCTAVTVTAGEFFGREWLSDPSSGRFSVSGDSLVVAGGSFYSMDARETSSVTVSNSPTFYSSVSFSAPSVEISGGTFCDKPYPDSSNGNWPGPTFSIVSTNAVISGGTFNGTLSGSGIVVSGGKFLWDKNEHMEKNGVIVLAEGKKLVKTGPASSINSPFWDRRKTYWEVRNK